MRRARCLIMTLVLALGPVLVQSDSRQTIVQLSEVKFEPGTLYTSIVRYEDEPAKARLLAADHESMTAVTMMTTDVAKLIELEKAIGQLIVELQDEADP